MVQRLQGVWHPLCQDLLKIIFMYICIYIYVCPLANPPWLGNLLGTYIYIYNYIYILQFCILLTDPLHNITPKLLVLLLYRAQIADLGDHSFFKFLFYVVPTITGKPLFVFLKWKKSNAQQRTSGRQYVCSSKLFLWSKIMQTKCDVPSKNTQ